MSEHTPGPWEVRTYYHTNKGFEKFIKGQEIVKVEQDDEGITEHTIARINWSNPVEANAKLIAAAPDLLEALTKLLYYTDLLTDKYSGMLIIGEKVQKTIDKSKQAIAKAVGEEVE